MNWKEKGFITIGALFTLTLAMPFASTLWISWATNEKIVLETAEAPVKDLALVLGAAVYERSLSPILEDRMDTAIELYRQKKVPFLLLSGAANEVKLMRQYGLAEGVPASAILEDPNGFNTLASILNVPKDKDQVAIVTQQFHLPRAIYYAEHFGLDAIGVSADRREYSREMDFRKRELIANTKAMFDVWITPRFNPLVKDL